MVDIVSCNQRYWHTNKVVDYQQSFANLEDWFALVQRTFDSDYMPYVALVANKADLTHLQTVKPELHREFADDNQMHRYMPSFSTVPLQQACSIV